ncbi:TPA: hypothetical protein IFM82_000238 [Escherichia coli]|nr:hypothetical protein [Escherichia coli]
MFRVFPAPAGINRVVLLYRCLMRRVPRASGDKPRTEGENSGAGMCSPRQRG